jgi:hypothetical protein
MSDRSFEDYKKFVDEFEEWVNQQVIVFGMAVQEAEKEFENNSENMDAASAIVSYGSRVDAYQFLQTKFEQFREGKDFHDLPDNMMFRKEYPAE